MKNQRTWVHNWRFFFCFILISTCNYEYKIHSFFPQKRHLCLSTIIIFAPWLCSHYGTISRYCIDLKYFVLGICSNMWLLMKLQNTSRKDNSNACLLVMDAFFISTKRFILFQSSVISLDIIDTQFVSSNQEGLFILYHFKNYVSSHLLVHLIVILIYKFSCNLLITYFKNTPMVDYIKTTF